jgi:hypothetical protein
VEFKLLIIVGPEVRPSGTVKDMEGSIIRLGFEQSFNRSFILDHFAWCSIYEMDGRDKASPQNFKGIDA